MNKQKQIEEIQNILPNIEVIRCMWNDFNFAEFLYDRGVRKIPENAVVLTEEEFFARDEKIHKADREYIKALEECINNRNAKVCKETAEKIMNDISNDIIVVNTKEYGNIEVVLVERLQEICGKIVEGK